MNQMPKGKDMQIQERVLQEQHEENVFITLVRC